MYYHFRLTLEFFKYLKTNHYTNFNLQFQFRDTGTGGARGANYWQIFNPIPSMIEGQMLPTTVITTGTPKFVHLPACLQFITFLHPT